MKFRTKSGKSIKEGEVLKAGTLIDCGDGLLILFTKDTIVRVKIWADCQEIYFNINKNIICNDPFYYDEQEVLVEKDCNIMEVT